MTPRKRARRRIGVDPAYFLYEDGLHECILDGDEPLGSLVEAEATWERCRVATWELWQDDPVRFALTTRPPMGAAFHDGITDASSVAEFRRRRPDAAATVVEGLDAYLGLLRWSDDAPPQARRSAGGIVGSPGTMSTPVVAPVD